MKQNTLITAKRPQILVPAHFVNDQLIIDPGVGYRPGQVFFANDSRFLTEYYSEAVTNYAVGFMDRAPQTEELDFLVPPVQVGRRFEWKATPNAEEWLSETFDDQRAIGSDFKRVEYTGSDVTDKTLNKGLTYIVDHDEETSANWQNEKAAKLLRRLLRNETRRAYTALDAIDVNTGKAWAPAPASPGVIPTNPDQDVKDDLLTSTNLTGLRPNRVVYGDTAWNIRGACYESQQTPGGYAGASQTPQSLAARLMVDRVMVSKSRYQSAAAAKTELLGSALYMFYAQDGVDREDATHIKRFWSACENGTKVRTYVQQLSAKLTAITVEHYSKIVATFTTGVRKFTVTG